MKTFAEKMYLRATRLLPPEIAGRLDLRRPSYLSGWGGPLNGQKQRRNAVREIARATEFDRVIETGTFRGNSSEFFAAVFGTPVDTVEGNPRSYEYARVRLASQPDIKVHNGDSRSFLRELGKRYADETVFIYLDAHWEDDLPLREELEIIAASWPRAAVMIDDFAVPGDDTYGYDDYGPGRALTAAYLPDEALSGWLLFYPASPGRTETGACRGSCLLLSPHLSALSGNLTSMRVAQKLGGRSAEA